VLKLTNLETENYILKQFIKDHPDSNIAAAYRLGMKDQLLKMQPEIDKVLAKKEVKA
jgi:hypothetical protein